MKYDLSIKQAHEIIEHCISILPAETVPVTEVSGRVLAEDCVAAHSLPAEPQSAVDGFALGDDKMPIQNRFAVKGFLDLGDFPDWGISGGQAAGVLTGGALPPGTRAVVPHEKVLLEDGSLVVLEEIKPGKNIKQVGEDFKQGETLAAAGTRIDPGYSALLAAFGFAQVKVYRCPKVAILGVGKNIIACSATPEPGQARDSNGAMMKAMVAQCGGRVVGSILAAHFGEYELAALIAQLSEQADIIIISGGTYAQSRGDARIMLESSGAELQYWGTSLQPGSHNGFALYKGVPVFILSGNPAACAVGFNLFVAPALRYLQGLGFGLKRVQAMCINTYPKAARTRRMLRGYAWAAPDGWKVKVLPGQKPSMIRSLLNCNALIDMPPGQDQIEAETSVSVILL